MIPRSEWWAKWSPKYAQNAQKFDWKTQSKIACSYAWLLHGRFAYLDDTSQYFFLNWKQAQQKVKQCSKKIRLRKGKKERQTPRLLSCNGRKWYPIYKVKFKKIISSSSVCKFTCTISYLCLRLLLFSSFPVCGSHGSLLITSESFEVAFDSILFGANTKWRQFSEVRHVIRTVSS